MKVTKSDSQKGKRQLPKKKDKIKGRKAREEKIYVGPGSAFVKPPKG